VWPRQAPPEARPTRRAPGRAPLVSVRPYAPCPIQDHFLHSGCAAEPLWEKANGPAQPHAAESKLPATRTASGDDYNLLQLADQAEFSRKNVVYCVS
jgi:hypothetical protein